MQKTQQRGVVLIVVLWITVLLTVLLVAFTATIKVDRSVATGIVQRAQARAGAEAVLNYLVAVQQAMPETLSRMAGQVYKLSLNSMDVRFRFIPEKAFISLNAAPFDDLAAAFNAAGADNAAQIAQYIVDRRSGMLAGGLSAGLDAPKLQPWISTVELATVPMISADVYARIQGWLTVDSDHSAVNFDFADVSVVRALKGNDAEQVLADRAERAVTNNGLDVSLNDVFRVQVELSSSANTRKIEATAAFSGNKNGYHVVRWNEYNTHFYLD